MINYQRAADILGEELRARGYTTRLDSSSKHPKFYIGAREKERFVVLSATANYDVSNLMKMKRADIERDVIPFLPTPTPASEPVLSSALPEPIPPVSEPAIEDKRSWPIKVSIGGHGVFIVILPKAIVPPSLRAELFLTQPDNHLALLFGEHGVEPSSTRGEDTVAFYFKRADVPFTYAQRQPPASQLPRLFARVNGNTVTLLTKLPPALLSDAVVTELTGEFSLEQGSKLLAKLNGWIKEAAARGHAPVASVNVAGMILVEVSERVSRRI